MMLRSACFPLLLLAPVTLPLLVGCVSRTDNEVVIYTAHDSVFSEPILDNFAQETGIAVRPKFDVESTKSVGLATAIMAEAKRPVCDVFWNNEILNTLRLKQQGLLDVYHSPNAETYPEAFRDADGMWYGFAARARILIVNTELMSAADRPTSVYDLASPKWKGRVGIAKPLFGTTATHAACLFSVLGDQKAKEFFRQLKDNEIQIMSGNKQVAIAVARGQLLFGLTDTDDAFVMIDQAHPVQIVYPDRNPDELGTLFIPNTLSIIRGCATPRASATASGLSAESTGGVTPGRRPCGADSAEQQRGSQTSRRETPATVKAMKVDFSEAAAKWDAAAEFIAQEFAAE